ncbi:hypothetical protein F0562_022615 [Nyssa sinensis]|uniref:Transposase MuDR plant domain-containing protein n=1 Tax=Nyssa sinensis TaxID=561372 RepID=A0A5J5BPP6_9ASTE|nr:hypothetical protein F0562_022615 [Nyssa sinensis]
MIVDSDQDVLKMFEICGKYKQIDIYVEFDETFVPLASLGSGRGSPKGFFSGYAKGSAIVTKKSTNIGRSSFVSAKGGGYANARGGRSASTRSGKYATAIGGEVSNARGGGIASARGGSSSARGGRFTSAGVRFSSASGGGFFCASCGGFARAVSDDDDFMFTDKDDGHISNYKSNDNCGAYSSDDDGQTRMTDRFALKDFSIQQGFKLVREKNDKNRVIAHCGIKGYKWKIHASILPDGVTFKIKSVGDDHTYAREARNSEAYSNWIAGKMANWLSAEPDLKLHGMYAEVIEKFGVEVSKMQLHRAKRKALEKLEGSYAKFYAKIPAYAHEVRKTNPNSLVKLELERIHPNLELPTFKRFFYFICSTNQGV